MSLADEIINGTYKKGDIKVNATNNKEQVAPVKSVADKIIDGTYKARSINVANRSYSTPSIRNRFSNTIQKEPKHSFFDRVQNIANTSGKIGQNALLGLVKGFKSYQQTMDQRMTETYSDRDKIFEDFNKKIQERSMQKGKPINLPTPIVSSEQLEEEGKKQLQKFQEEKKQINNKITENTESIDNPTAKKLAEVAPSIGNMGLGFVPGVGALLITGSAAGEYYDDGKQRGMSDKEAKTYSGFMSLMEGATEMVGIENLSKAGKVAKSLIKGAGKEGFKQIAKTGFKEMLKQYGIGIADNVMQEAIIEPIQEFTAQTVAGKDKANWDNMGQRMFNSGFNGGLVSAIMGGANVGISSCVGVVDKINSGQTVSQQELKTAVKDASKQFDVSKMIIDSTQQQIEKYKNNNQPTAPIQQTQNQPTAPINTLNQQNQTQNEQILPTQPIPPINNNEDINPYRDTARANKLIKEKNELIRQVETDMQQTTLPQAKNILNQRIQEIENDYNEKIQGLYDNVNRNQKQNEIETTEKNPTRHEIIQKNREVARENIKNISNWKDKKRGLSYQLETMERNMYDIIPDKAEAKKINETYFEPIHVQEAQKQKFINSYNDRIKQFNLNKYESEAVQLLGEQKYNPDFKADEVKEVLDRVNKNIEDGKVDKQKVNNTIEEFRTIYDELFEQENKALRDNGYKEKPYRKGYFPHFIDYVPETKTEKLLNKLGFKIDKRPLPTDIAGITEQFVPGKTWNRSALERKTNKTDYNALKGFDTYIAQASDNIFHTENIQRLRGLENEIRYQYSDKGVQERIDKILNDETLYAEEKQDMINNIFEQVDNPMPNLVTELRRYTNALANKKSEADRSIENMIGRDVYSTVNAIENKFGANAVGLNFGSAFTNIIPITQAWSQVSTKNMSRAAIDTVKSYLTNDGFVDNSNFLTSRLNQSDKLYKTGIEKISDKSSFLFKAIDDVTSNIVVRGKYLENIEKGMSQTEAIKDADQFARNVMADRSKGALPTKFEEKNPITKAFTQFQLEVNNQYRYMFKDIPRDLAEKGLGKIALAFFKMFVGAWLYNEASERITGRRPAFDPIELIKSAYKDFTDEDKSTYDKLAGTIQNVGEELPFVGGLMGGGRIPVNGAIPSISNVAKAGTGLITGEMDSKKALNTLGKEFAKPAYYLVPPFGGAQLKKSVEGISTVTKGGSYGVDKEGKETLQFPVENPKATDYIKAGIFGKYAVPLAKNYTDSNYKSLNAKQTKAYKESNVPYKEYLTYLKQDLKKNEDKISYINKQNWNDSQRWGIYANEILSDKEREDGGSQLKDAQYAIKNGTSKSEYMKLYNETSKRKMSMPTTKEMQELKKQNLELKDYVNYQVKVHDKTALYKKSGQLDENEQLKNKDKMQLLLDSDYTNKQKTSLYESCIKSKEKEDTISTYEIMKKAGLNINEWLKYSQQEFESDKEDDGTIKGKSVDGSKKQKVYSYINSANMNYEQRLLLLGTQYKLNNSERRILVNYVNNMKADYSTRMKIFSKIKGVTVYKNGTIKF